MIAAIVSVQNKDEVTIFEHMPRMGKKLLLTGSGKCNISNTDMDISHFHGGDMSRIKAVLEKCPPDVTLDFFRGLGLLMRERKGGLYPYCEQASAVVDVLRFSIRDLGVDVLTQANVLSVQKLIPSDNGLERGFAVTTDQGRFLFDKVIMCTGSACNRNTGSDGSGYSLAKALGHTVIKPAPALTHLKCEEDFFASIAGIRTQANVSLYECSKDCGKETLLGSMGGELQITRSGISGIPVMNLSFLAVRALDDGQKIKGSLDLLPDVDEEDIQGYIRSRIDNNPDRLADELFIGVLAKPLGMCICKRANVGLKTPCKTLTSAHISILGKLIKKFDVTVTGYGGFDESQSACGGVSLLEVDDDLESTIVPGLFFAGEILDVNGDCGGYNLQWAASSAMVAARRHHDSGDMI
ncbi:MAG: aminoacetone oxidase family FAD-binding enzyme [Lachnospiraceae bacterium]|nr:aminoacetone oxidase family FAD-binding enzyme [Lachnospiraceae bacterium]